MKPRPRTTTTAEDPRSLQYLGRIERAVRRHEQWRLRECLNLIPSENHGSAASRALLSSDFGNRYNAPDRFYRGTRYTDEVLSVTEELARKVFRAKFADVRPLSGHTANLAVLLTMAQRGDSIVSVSPDDGGYPGISPQGLGGLLGLRNLYFPFDRKAVNIKPKESTEQAKKSDPRLLIFGASYITFPHPLESVSTGPRITKVYDGSHVLGLIAGGQFQDPLREGCPLLFGSTHKSLPGPQGGILLSNDEDTFQVSSKIFPGIVDNIHLNRVAALGVALLEMLKFGREYAEQIVQNSQALARALSSRGVEVRGASHGFTKSHQVLLDYSEARFRLLSEKLEQANIIVDEAGRIGTSELTRMGYRARDMEEVAELVSLVVLGKERPGSVKKRVKRLVAEFQEPRFVLSSPPDRLA
ncbi:MAG: hypothetical protein HY247_01900 [archaeon]|nr:MAG: hypothetical protein HY247_01900 [archaeon]